MAPPRSPGTAAPQHLPSTEGPYGVIAGANPIFGPAFTVRNRIGRALWGIAYVLAFRPSPRPLHAWRALLLRAFGARLGRHVHVYPRAQIWAPWNLEIGDWVAVADGVNVYNMATIRIGDYSMVSAGTHLCGGSHDADSANFQLVAKPITIAPYVWICAEAFIAPGVNVPEGAVIAARAVVTRSPSNSWTVYAGVPARPIRARAPNLKQHMQSAARA